MSTIRAHSCPIARSWSRYDRRHTSYSAHRLMNALTARWSSLPVYDRAHSTIILPHHLRRRASTATGHTGHPHLVEVYQPRGNDRLLPPVGLDSRHVRRCGASGVQSTLDISPLRWHTLAYRSRSPRNDLPALEGGVDTCSPRCAGRECVGRSL